MIQRSRQCNFPSHLQGENMIQVKGVPQCSQEYGSLDLCSLYVEIIYDFLCNLQMDSLQDPLGICALNQLKPDPMTVLIAKSSKKMRFYRRNSFVCILWRPCLDLDKQKVPMVAEFLATQKFRFQFLSMCKNDDKLPRSDMYFD